ncbi:hypothetical protein BVG19_g1026 [[Candida] boidinii]|nr:hypothetical protein BVG19_g1026 [[Candida] boidinii]OWB50635.1 hypothetical protein B5S27_g2187 [[Candida] boidinii]
MQIVVPIFWLFMASTCFTLFSSYANNTIGNYTISYNMTFIPANQVVTAFDSEVYTGTVFAITTTTLESTTTVSSIASTGAGISMFGAKPFNSAIAVVVGGFIGSFLLS